MEMVYLGVIMIIKNPYETKGLKLVKLPNIDNVINEYIISHYSYIKDNQSLMLKSFENEDTKLNPVIIYGETVVEKDIIIFNQPYVNYKNNWLALDLRKVVGIDSETKKFKIRNESEFRQIVTKYILSGMWFVDKQNSIYGLKFAHIAFGEWLSSTISRKFGLDLSDQVKIKVLANAYYASMFSDKLEDEDIDKLKIRLKDEIINPGIIDENKEIILSVNSIDDFCKACYEITNNIRLQNFDYNVLISVVNNNWFGLNAHENVLLALEHPPTWISIVYSSLLERSFKNSYITKIVEQKNKKGSGKDFINQVSALVDNYKVD